VSRDEGELLTAQTPRAVGSFSVCLSVKPVGEPDALIGHVRFDERGWETGRWPTGPSYRAYPRLYHLRHPAMSALRPLLGEKRKCCERNASGAPDPSRKSRRRPVTSAFKGRPDLRQMRPDLRCCPLFRRRALPDVFAAPGALNRHNATTPMARGFSSLLQAQRPNPCCASKPAGNPHEMGIVALWRIKNGYGDATRGCLRRIFL
jgi:hypothetical protein